MRGYFWIIAIDLLGLALLAAMVSGGTKSGIFATILIAAPLAMAAMMFAPSTDNDA